MATQHVEAIFDDKEVVSFFKALQTNLSSIKGGEKEYVGLLSAIVFRDIEGHFRDEQGSEGPWEKRTTQYASRLNKEGRGSSKLLQISGRLRQNFVPNKDYRTSGQEIIWFNNAHTKSGFPYAAAHDVGGSVLPQRDFMWLSKDGAEDISKQTLAFMLEKGI